MMTTSDGTTDDNLQGAFGDRGTNVNAIAYGHPHGDSLIEQARDILNESKSGQIFLQVMDSNKIPVHIMNGMGESGFSAEMKTIFLQVPKKEKKISGSTIIQFLQGLSEADQEYGGMKAPDPMKDVLGFAEFMHTRNLNAITHTCMVIQELTDSEHFPILLDSLGKIGLNDFYKAYVNGASRRELYRYYAEAYNNRRSN